MSDPSQLPLTPQAAAVLHHPDQRTAWVILMAATLSEPVGDLRERLAALGRMAPITTARLTGDHWACGSPLEPWRGDPDPLTDARLCRPFDLRHEPPLRVALDASGTRIALAGHHAALDGLGMAGVLQVLVGGPGPDPDPLVPADGPAGPKARRALARADRVAPSVDRPAQDTLVARTIVISGAAPTARLAAACAAAAQAHNARRASPWRRVGISIGIGGRPGLGNTASYRRIDVRATGDVAAAVQGALAGPTAPGETAPPGRWFRLLSPVVTWFSDSILVSNLGRLDVPGVARVEFFPVARGRSAVSFGAAGLVAGSACLTVRARDLDLDDATRLLDDAIERYASASPH